ncbi:hypothetical protein GYMLUDRAFT_251034 [Collybiopsis luxurians FD-317 M1]|uniref:CxC2-like cysteine cluster KDZ transposase-associated domain-containing protein n=1 Tax=Collybiopsis luxurians FD-317 M1 TaxID=944289 RepID=A0A0D0CCM7_9AGAR|nr:hypothetical protein GYMLUDRAFT_251034 [Collybiopsis luxurians FD-317 M1]
MLRAKTLPAGVHTSVHVSKRLQTQVANHRYTEISSTNRSRTYSIPLHSNLDANRRPSAPTLTEPYRTSGASTEPHDDSKIDLLFLDSCNSTFTYTFSQPNAAEPFEAEPSVVTKLDEVQLNALKEWEPEIPAFSYEILRHEGLENAYNSESGCPCDKVKWKNEPLQMHRCVDCFEPVLCCKDCLLRSHESNPFHNIERWTGTYFESTSLHDLGLVLHLGHSLLLPCLAPSKIQAFTIIDINRIHRAAIRFSTLTAPQTAVTFKFLEFFQMLSFMSKVSAMEYYSTLERMTDNTGTDVPKNCSHEQSGVGYDGVDGSASGVLAVKCPACPHAGLNIPTDWWKDPERRWLNKVFFALDANFRLTRFNVSSEERDPALNKGRAYMVDDRVLQQHIATFQGHWPPEKSDCSDHDAIKLANRRGDHNLATTGLALATCARHDSIHARSGVDLRLGEEYILMDFALLLSIKNFPNLPVTVSYDIMCQYSKKLYQRIASYPSILHTPTPFPRYQLLVPKFHLAAHKQECIWSFSYNYAMGVGRTDATLIHDKALEAAKLRPKMVTAYLDASEGLDESTKTYWRNMVTEWEQDPDRKKKNPYQPQVREYTLHQICLELVREDEELIRNDLAAQAVSSRITRTQLICQGIELEEQQRRLRYDVAHIGNGATSLAQTKITERANNLHRKINAFSEVQALHMPVTVILRQQEQQRTPGNTAQAAYDLPLLLPSEVLLMGSSCDQVLLDYEWRLRYAAANDALEQMRKHLLSKNAVLGWKLRYGHGVREGNRSQNDVDRLNDKISACAARYRIHFKMIEKFSDKLGKVNWSNSLKSLRNEDIRSISRGKDNNPTGEGYVISSWIWNTPGVDHTDEENVAEFPLPLDPENVYN